MSSQCSSAAMMHVGTMHCKRGPLCVYLHLAAQTSEILTSESPMPDMDCQQASAILSGLGSVAGDHVLYSAKQ